MAVDTSVAHFRFLYPATNQAPDALLARATHEAKALFIEANKFDFLAVYDTYEATDEDEVGDPPGTVAVAVMATFANKKSFLDYVLWPIRAVQNRKQDRLSRTFSHYQ